MPRDRAAASSEPKMVLVLRGELRLTAGKSAVQAAHAAVLLSDRGSGAHPTEVFRAWKATGQRKIAVVVETLAEMQLLAREARARGLPTVLVEDAGHTEVAPGTITCLGIGPARPGDVDPLTGKLPLL